MGILAACLWSAVALSGTAYAQQEGIVLHAYSTDRGDGEDPNIEKSALAAAEADKSPGRRVAHTQTPADLARELKRLQDSGVRVRKLVIYSHGAPGLSGPMDADSLRLFRGLDGAFAPNAQIVFNSCSIAQGQDGVKFIQEASKTLLGKNGGTVIAPVWYYAGVRPQVAGALAQSTGQVGGSPMGYMEARVAPGGEVQLLYTQPGRIEAQAALEHRMDQAQALMDAAQRGEKTVVRGVVNSGMDVAELQELGLRVSMGMPLGPSVTRDARGFIVRNVEAAVEAQQRLQRSALQTGRNAVGTVLETDRAVRQFVQDRTIQTVRTGVELERQARPYVRAALPAMVPGAALLNSLFDRGKK